MTESEWQTCTDPEQMLAYLEDRTSARKFRLYHCALLRKVWTSLEASEQQQVVVTERHFDTALGSSQPAALRRAAQAKPWNQTSSEVWRLVMA